MAHETILTIKKVKEEIANSLEYDFFSNKPLVGDKSFDTIEEAIEYEFNIEEAYDPIRHLSPKDKVVQYWDEHDSMCFKPYCQ